MPCCGVLIDFFLTTKLSTNRQEITQYRLSIVLKPVFVPIDVFDRHITVTANIRSQN